MTWYLIRRVGQAAAVVLGVLILTFILIHNEPGSTARAILGLKATPARVALFDHLYGLDKPIYQQFVIYVKNVVHGNLGTSYQLQQPVSTLIAERLPRDAVLLGISTLLALVVGVPMGIYQALRHNMFVDDVLSGTWFTLYSAPDFMEALLLIALVCVQFHWLQPNFPGGITSVGGILADWRADPAGRGAGDQYGGRVQSVCEVLGDPAASSGLHPRGPGQGSAGAAGSAPAPAAQFAAAGRDDSRPVPARHRRRRDYRGGDLQFPRHGPALLAGRPFARLPDPARHHAYRRGGRGRGQPAR